MEVIWSDLAFESFRNIVQYVQEFFGKDIADNTAIKIISFVESLKNSPQLGKRLLHLSQHGEIRCAFYKQNHIYYQMLKYIYKIFELR